MKRVVDYRIQRLVPLGSTRLLPTKLCNLELFVQLRVKGGIQRAQNSCIVVVFVCT